MQLAYHHVLPLFQELNTTTQPLLSRGEAHITVISPPEYLQLAKANLTIHDINAIALNHRIQSSQFHIVCLGKVTIVLEDREHVVYQIIMDSPQLIRLREEIFRLYYDRGGNVALFDPHNFYPHITLGFTVRDLHPEQGVFKGYNVCHRVLLVK
ncbi:hypothetical protein DFQ30_002177 [Apophysomyces sp. BC1015]|nr:hypothetical protein DFQ30_002177 [Apophysomyces sp. BC1015]